MFRIVTRAPRPVITRTRQRVHQRTYHAPVHNPHGKEVNEPVNNEEILTKTQLNDQMELEPKGNDTRDHFEAKWNPNKARVFTGNVNLRTDEHTRAFVYTTVKGYGLLSHIFSGVLNLLGFNFTGNNTRPENAENQDSTRQMEKRFASKSRESLISKDYVASMKIVYCVYKECYEVLESRKKSPGMDTLAADDQIKGNYKVDDHREHTLEEVREKLDLPNRNRIMLLNLVVDAEKNTNSTVLLHQIKSLFAHPACDLAEDKEQLVKFISLIRKVFPDRLAAELKAQKVSEDKIEQLINAQLDDNLLNLWQESTKDIKLPLAHTQWCAVPNGLRTGKIEDYYQLLQIAAHPTLGRKASLILISVPKELEHKIRVAFSEAKANVDKGKGGVYQVYMNPADMLSLLHFSSVKIIYQDDRRHIYNCQKISERKENGDNVITMYSFYKNKSEVICLGDGAKEKELDSKTCQHNL
ncbi:Uncharacterised protein [Legionella lansingensis]|uniref:Uncharacterized protein n=1 Tax=Legionella lansingensis TaxID=45067 RepID=A0A0W0VFY6_9GAMM|nr:hypothetical protein [Legionella lansingensis]KTD19075.1 hypothetical protein Llan_2275 [Legionella lansingensis]SNV52096.1 Uncharacterised protein [Legionella lansingensis]